LKWHKDGCYAVVFGNILESSEISQGGVTGIVHDEERGGSRATDVHDDTGNDGSGDDSRQNMGEVAIVSAEQRRINRVKETHWLAAGSKDGKVSLWSLY